MAHTQDTHFFTDLGALCGASPPYRWSLNEARATCRECRALLNLGLRNRRIGIPRQDEDVVTPGRLRGSR